MTPLITIFPSLFPSRYPRTIGPSYQDGLRTRLGGRSIG